ncbi:hypothetical protein [Mucilaginibacter aquatilis]|uniref:Carboxypeptidase-like regulatory domain-containing protein n=1 Tax=Mucilaginibacter aquatilis TaxID=1517760 RepID=A0A6I4IAY9_9SPHI|nr:hypothetical protein [Mucilaginibacter aquatilis]MVN91088.1 hypothetical protein [Mucilaginibacter aquatilis]
MRFLLFVLLTLITAFAAVAQRVNGVVIDRLTKLPVYSAKVTTPHSVAFTEAQGSFTLSKTNNGDSCIVNAPGYKLHKVVLKGIVTTDTLKILLDKPSIILRDVNVTAWRDLKADSVRNRQLFSEVYNYKRSGVKELMANKVSLVDKPRNYIDNPANTTSIGGFNVLSAIGLFSKNKQQTSKLQKTLLEDEQEGFIDRSFTKRKVIALTALKGDSLTNFMIRYRPTAYQIKTMTDYELAMYIKASYNEFKKLLH